MTLKIFILIHSADPAQQQIADLLRVALINNDIPESVIVITSDWPELQPCGFESKTLISSVHRIVFNLSLDPGQWYVVDSTSCWHVVLAGFRNGYLQPLSRASGIQEVADRCSHTDLVIASPAGAGAWTPWLHASIPTLNTWRQNQRQLFAVCAEYAAFWLRNCQRSSQLKSLGKPVSCVGVSSVRISRWQRFSIQLRRTIDRIWSRVRRSFHGDQMWQIGWLDSGLIKPVPMLAGLSHGHVWFADPYIWKDKKERIWILCEQFDDHSDRVGRIFLFRLHENKILKPCGVVLSEPFHLSFPRLIEHQDSLYLTVESCQNLEVRIYAAAAITESWTLQRILLQGEAFIDPVLFQHDDDRWYLFVSTTSAPSLKRETAPELRLFVSDNLLEGQFREHPQSPLLISSNGGRNAGLLQQDHLYRVGQQTGFGGIYGQSIVVFRIDELSESTYRETAIPCLPNGFPPSHLKRCLRASHLHTLNNYGNILTYDFISA